MVICVALAFILTAQPSRAITFSFPGSSTNSTFSFVSRPLPQALQYSFGSVIPQSFQQIMPPTVSSQYIFGGTTQQSPRSFYGSRSSGSSYVYGGGSTSGTSGSSYTYGSGSFSGGSSYVFGGSSSQNTSGPSGSSYVYNTGSSNGGTSGDLPSGIENDNADGPNDAMMVPYATGGATTVNLVLNGQPVQAGSLPPFLQGQNPFSYWLMKGKPGGTVVKLPSAKKPYAFNTSSNAFTLQSCNPNKKPFNWSIQVDPNSIPQNVVLMNTPQVSGGQACSAGVTGSCKKPTLMCYYGNTYTSQSAISGTSFVAGGPVSNWTVNMCLRWVYPAPMLVQANASGQPVGWLYNLPAGGALTATANFGKTLPLAQTSVVVSIPTTSAPVLFSPGPFNLKYNGASGVIPGVTGSWSIAGMQFLDSDSSILAQCLGQSCVTNGLGYNVPCTDSPDGFYILNAHSLGLAVYFYNTAGARPAHLPTVAPSRTTQPQY